MLDLSLDAIASQALGDVGRLPLMSSPLAPRSRVCCAVPATASRQRLLRCTAEGKGWLKG